MADVVIKEKRGVFEVTLTSDGGVKAGELLARSGTSWKKADADNNTLPAEAIACQTIDASGKGEACVEAILYDTDAPYTAGDIHYLSETAGATTATRPTTAASLRQVVGIAKDTEHLHVAMGAFKEVEVSLFVMESTSGEAALGSRVALDSGRYEGLQHNAQNEYTTFGAILPDNCLSVLRAEVWGAEEAAGSRTFAIEVNSVVAEAAWDAVTADTSETTKALFDNGAADPINVYNFTAALNATNIVRPGAFLAMKFNADDAGTDAQLIFGGRLICKVA